jgi:hypothetical protein
MKEKGYWEGVGGLITLIRLEQLTKPLQTSIRPYMPRSRSGSITFRIFVASVITEATYMARQGEWRKRRKGKRKENKGQNKLI